MDFGQSFPLILYIVFIISMTFCVGSCSIDCTLCKSNNFSCFFQRRMSILSVNAHSWDFRSELLKRSFVFFFLDNPIAVMPYVNQIQSMQIYLLLDSTFPIYIFMFPIYTFFPFSVKIILMQVKRILKITVPGTGL